MNPEEPRPTNENAEAEPGPAAPSEPESAPAGRTPSSPADGAAPSPSPRTLRTMATVRWLLLAFVTALAGLSVWSFWGPGHDHDHGTEEEARYYCPMHPEIRSPRPGNCPICHMKLEPIPEERRSSEAPPHEQPHGAAHEHGAASAHDAAGARDATAHHGAPSHSAGARDTGAHDAKAPSAGVVTLTLSHEKQTAVGLTTSPVESLTLGDKLRVPAVLSAPETGLSQVRVRASGFVERVAVRQTGVRVTRGQPLAYVYSPEIYRAQEELLAAARWSKASADAATEPRPDPNAADLLTAARRGLELLGLTPQDIEAIEQSGQALRAVPVRATSSGFVTRFNAVLGSRAEPETVLYEIADLSKLWLVASVHERDTRALRAGTDAKFFLSGHAEDPLPARVELIEPSLEEATRTTRVRLALDNREGRLRPGQFGEVELELPAAEGLFVPRDAVIRTGENEYVYVAIAPDTFEPRSVRSGPTRDGRTQILSGLVAGERVVTRGNFVLDSESRLRASLQRAPAGETTP